MQLSHTFEPVYDHKSEILILGTFPSVKSRESAFYYGHPQNRFWKLLAVLKNEEVPGTIEEKKAFLLRNKIAIWDVIYSCDIEGSSDSSIKNVIPNDIAKVIKESSIKRVYANGDKACKLYRKFCETNVGIEIIGLPSTSPANAAFSMDKLKESWKEALDGIT